MQNILIVDGYNIVGAWPKLQKLRDIDDLDAARDELIDALSQYQAVTGYKVILVFDAHFVEGIEKREKKSKVEVIFTRKNQSADEKIEKLAIELKRIDTKIYVATSDFTEQWTIFGQGALRKSARELIREISLMEQTVKKEVKEKHQGKASFRPTLDEKVADVFEKWRRGEK
ncbi:MAG: NYN domain-containing protein [Bacillaceae bacterium]